MVQTEQIFVGQSELRIELDCSIDITDATAREIRYKKPSGTVGHWDATALDQPAGIIYYDVVDENDIDEAGVWTLWPFVTFADARSAPGASTTMTVSDEPGIETQQLAGPTRVSKRFSHVVKNAITKAPIVGVEITITSDDQGANVLGKVTTDENGSAKIFVMTQKDKVYVWRKKSGIKFNDPVEEKVE
jgi:hypothetical protein